MTAASAPTLTRSTFWAQGACLELPAEWFYPARGESTANAKAVCATCTVRVECLAWAVDNRETSGIWGGTSERERRRIRRRIAAGQHVPQFDREWSTGHRSLVPPSPPPPAEPPREEPVNLAAVTTDPPRPTNGTRPVDPATGLPTDACANCGKRYTPKRRDQRFHSKECARAWYASHPRGEGGVRKPRIRPPVSAKRPKPRAAEAAPPSPALAVADRPATERPPGVDGTTDVQTLLGQILAACDRWAIEADLGDIRVSVTRGCP